MKLEFGDTEEYIKLRTDFNKDTKSMAMLNKVGYIKWLEHKLVNNVNYTRCCTELKDKEGITFEAWLKVNCEYLNDDYYLYNEETYNRYDIHTKFITEIKQNL